MKTAALLAALCLAGCPSSSREPRRMFRAREAVIEHARVIDDDQEVVDGQVHRRRP